MKFGKYFVFVLLIIEGVFLIFPKILGPIFDLNFGIITIGSLLGVLNLGAVFWMLTKKGDL